MVDVTISSNNIELFINKFLNILSKLIENGLVKSVPVDKGFLKNSIDVRLIDNKIVISMAEYGKFVEYGTAPHIIRPVNGKTLHWKSGGKDIFAKIVNHPGTKPNPFIRRTFFTKFKSYVETASKIAEREVYLI